MKLVAVLLLIIGAVAEAHQCMHDDPHFRSKVAPEFDLKDYSTIRSPQQGDDRDPSSHAFTGQALGREPIRIVISDDDVYSGSCISSNSSVNDYQGGTIACSSDTVMTTAKRDALLNKIIPGAVALLSNALSVTPIIGNLIVTTKCSSPFTTPTSHRTTGVPNADFVLYVASVPTSGSTVAWAGFCSVNLNSRPITGRMNINPKYITYDEADPAAIRNLERTVAHELLHALGFSSGFWSNGGFPSDPVRSETRRGKSVTIIGSTNARTKAREHFNCTTMNGPEIEDQGGSGTGGSHWERRNHLDDIMSGITGPQMFLSPVTLGLMQDSGHYDINWNAAESPEWMRNAGCGSQFDKCNEKCGGKGTAFCDIQESTSKDKCDFAYRGYGTCGIGSYTSDLPSYAQYDPSNPRRGGTSSLMDYCPKVVTYSNRECDNPANTYANNTQYGEYFATDGRCFETSASATVQQTGAGGSRTAGEPRCLQTRCVQINSEFVVQFKIKSSKPWASCGASGSLVNLTSYGYDGQIVCPDSGAMCLQATQIVNLTGTFASRQESFCTAPTREAGGTGSGIAAMSSLIPLVLAVATLLFTTTML